ncbi:flagellar hook-basal body protein [Marinicrinis sediminis]|uniref:Flagellar hook-basal body protein n=1 Tax=Marinicrinis sediminis TaxID=1652465 RepID=A0ABW5RAH7_9BACL
MLRGLYTAASGLVTQQRRHDTITTNISNIQTPGYKAQNTMVRSFPEMLLHLIGDEPASRANSTIGTLHNGVYAEELVHQFMQGDLEQTGRPTDFALVSHMTEVDGTAYAFDASGQAVTEDGDTLYQPQAFFAIEAGDGTQRYTRNGQFQLTNEGMLVHASGAPVLNRNGESVVLGADAAGIAYTMDRVAVSEGGLLVDKATGQAINDENGDPLALGIAQINNPNELVLEGNGLYRLDSEDAEVAFVADTSQVQVLQGYSERSNVDAARSMVEMMEATRAYEANQKMIQFYDRSLEKTVSEIGRV